MIGLFNLEWDITKRNCGGDEMRKRRQKVIQKAPAAAKPSDICFTIMPFGGWFDDYYESIYVPAITKAGLVPKRADDLYRPSTIVNDIWSYTQQAKLILADLSGKNPNVFYELGLAHALAKPAILIAESMGDIPFDLRALRVIEYDKNQPRWGEELGEKIARSIKEVVAAPIQSVLPAFLSVKAEAKPKPVSPKTKDMLEIRRELDLLRSEIGDASRRRAIDDEGALRAPHEAEEVVTRYLEMGMPLKAIERRLERRGVPPNWTRSKIQEFKRRRKQPAPVK